MLTHVATSARNGCAGVCRVHFRRTRVFNKSPYLEEKCLFRWWSVGYKIGRGVSAGKELCAGKELRAGKSLTEVNATRKEGAKW